VSDHQDAAHCPVGADPIPPGKRLRSRALVLATSNIAEFAWSPFETAGTNRKYLAIIEGMDFSVHRRLILG
jgi:hypothetical protein